MLRAERAREDARAFVTPPIDLESRTSSAPPHPATVAALLRLSFFVGLFAFGGGFAIIARIKQRVVDELGWMTPGEFNELMAVTAALPGTNAANLLTILGASRVGVGAAAAACALFLLPGVALMLLFAIFYEQLRGVHGMGGALEGITAAVVGMVAAVAEELRPAAVKSRLDAVILVLAFAALASHALGLLEVVALSALYGVFMARRKEGGGNVSNLIAIGGASAAGKTASLFLSFAKVSMATFGGGVAMIPAVEHEVLAHGWVTGAAFTDAIAFSQVTPGPIGNCSTFLGYRAGGYVGALAATLGIFLPPLLLSLFVASKLSALRENRTMRAVLAGVSVAVVAAMAAAAFAVYRVGVHGVTFTSFAIAVFVWRRLRPKHSTLYPILVGGLLGAARALVHV